jgi:hypothetical protein
MHSALGSRPKMRRLERQQTPENTPSAKSPDCSGDLKSVSLLPTVFHHIFLVDPICRYRGLEVAEMTAMMIGRRSENSFKEETP